MLSKITLIDKIKIIFNETNSFFNKNWVVFYLLLLSLSFFFLVLHVFSYIKSNNYSHLHTEIFTISLLCFVSLLFVRTSVLWFLIPFLLVKVINFDTLLEGFQNYFFYKSIFSNLFKNVGSKDINVIFISIFFVYAFFVILFLIFQKTVNHQWHLKSVFLLITLSVYLMTTFLFHYFLIEKNYRMFINEELSHMEKVSYAPESDFFKICENQLYYCANSDNNAKAIIGDIKFNEYFGNLAKNITVKGNFPISNINDIYLIIKVNNQWVINKDLASKTFHDAQNFLMICLDIAHGFWLFFFIWLNLFHFRKRLKVNHSE